VRGRKCLNVSATYIEHVKQSIALGTRISCQ